VKGKKVRWRRTCCVVCCHGDEWSSCSSLSGGVAAGWTPWRHPFIIALWRTRVYYVITSRDILADGTQAVVRRLNSSLPSHARGFFIAAKNISGCVDLDPLSFRDSGRISADPFPHQKQLSFPLERRYNVYLKQTYMHITVNHLYLLKILSPSCCSFLCYIIFCLSSFLCIFA